MQRTTLHLGVDDDDQVAEIKPREPKYAFKKLEKDNQAAEVSNGVFGDAIDPLLVVQEPLFGLKFRF